MAIQLLAVTVRFACVIGNHRTLVGVHHSHLYKSTYVHVPAYPILSSLNSMPTDCNNYCIFHELELAMLVFCFITSEEFF